MARPLRYLPPDCPLVEVTCRTIHGRMLLRPSEELNRRVVGVLARTARLYEVGVCAFVFLSNHYHLLLRPRDAPELARFMNYLNSNLAREAGRLHGWRERFWGAATAPTPFPHVKTKELFEKRVWRGILDNDSRKPALNRPRTGHPAPAPRRGSLPLWKGLGQRHMSLPRPPGGSPQELGPQPGCQI